MHLPKIVRILAKLNLMIEKIIDLYDIDLLLLFGTNNNKLYKIKNHFPDIKLVSRGNQLKVLGSQEKIEVFELKFNILLEYLNKYNSLTVSEIDDIILNDDINLFDKKDDIILHGVSGKIIKPRSVNQAKMLNSILNHDMMFAIGPAGTGKTYTAVAIAVKALKRKQVKRIILTRPAVESGENLGFLPGDLKEKLDPYMQPLYDSLNDMIRSEKLKYYFENGIIQIAPLAFMRGRTLENSFVILDEAQNATESQMKMFLTRMGLASKFIITGDDTQIDLPKSQNSGLLQAIKRLKHLNNISFIYLNDKDVIRHKLVKQIINSYKKDKK